VPVEEFVKIFPGSFRWHYWSTDHDPDFREYRLVQWPKHEDLRFYRSDDCLLLQDSHQDTVFVTTKDRIICDFPNQGALAELEDQTQIVDIEKIMHPLTTCILNDWMEKFFPLQANSIGLKMFSFIVQRRKDKKKHYRWGQDDEIITLSSESDSDEEYESEIEG